MGGLCPRHVADRAVTLHMRANMGITYQDGTPQGSVLNPNIFSNVMNKIIAIPSPTGGPLYPMPMACHSQQPTHPRMYYFRLLPLKRRKSPISVASKLLHKTILTHLQVTHKLVVSKSGSACIHHFSSLTSIFLIVK